MWRTRSPITVEGNAGYFLGGQCGRRDDTGPDIVINGFVGWSVGENLMGGCIRVQGSASQSAGSSARGGRIFIEGDASLRAGISLKGGTLVIAGDAGAMTGFMAQAGTILIGGDAGDALGDSLYEAVIYVHGAIASLGADAVVEELSDDDVLTVKRWSRPAASTTSSPRRSQGWPRLGSSTTSPPTTTPPTDGRPTDPAAPPNATFPPEVIARVHEMAATGQYPIRGLGARRKLPTFDDLVFVTASVSRYPLEGYRERCQTKTVLGGRHGATPIELDIPITIAGMSFGALSASAKEALGRAATEVGTSTTTGDGGMTPEERKSSSLLVYQVLPSRYGFDPADLRQADAVEIVIGQGAKPGGGGMLLGQKVNNRVATMRTLPPGIDQRSASRHPDWVGPDDLRIKIEELREATGWRIPVYVKMAPPGSTTTSSWPSPPEPTSSWSTACKAVPRPPRMSSSSTPVSPPCQRCAWPPTRCATSAPEKTYSSSFRAASGPVPTWQRPSHSEPTPFPSGWPHFLRSAATGRRTLTPGVTR